MNAASLPHEKLVRSIELIGKRVVPALHKEIVQEGLQKS
jgi:hypothetical protein